MALVSDTVCETTEEYTAFVNALLATLYPGSKGGGRGDTFQLELFCVCSCFSSS